MLYLINLATRATTAEDRAIFESRFRDTASTLNEIRSKSND